MLRLFSSIRKTLINEGKTSRYVRYAVGEVLLIMVGIILALQFQNWNEERKSQLRVSSHLEELREELLFDLENLQGINPELQLAEKAALEIMGVIVGDIEGADEERLKEDLFNAGALSVFSASRVAYENLVSSGDIEHLKNNNLKRLLGAFHNQTDWSWTYHDGPMLANYEEFLSIRHNFIEPLYYRNRYLKYFHEERGFEHGETLIPSSGFSIDQQALKKDAKLRSILDEMLANRVIQRSQYSLIEENIRELIELIEKALQAP